MNPAPPRDSLPLTREWIAARLALSRAGRGLAGDDPGPGQPEVQPGVAAAVLIPLVDREAGLTVLLTQRTAHLNDHAGQISFPGGRAEPGDEGPEATALREAEEEIGLPRACVEVLGVLPQYRTATGFAVTPVVGFVRPPFSLELDAFEVAEVFEVPLEFLLDPAHHQRHTVSYKGQIRGFYAMPFEGRFIWGATAGMLYNLYLALRG